MASVPRGRNCGCICPSCKTPLIARQGELKEWHFAHRSRSVHEDTKKECEYSFAVSVRLMIRQLSVSGLKFRTPKFIGCIQNYSEISHRYKRIEFVITEESVVQLINPKAGEVFSGVEVDVLGYVSEIPFIVYVTYKGRGIPEELKHPKMNRSGVVEIALGSLAKAFTREREGRYIEVLKKHIEETLEGKSWVYHPRVEKARKQAEAKMSEWLLRQQLSRKKLFQAFTRGASSHADQETFETMASPKRAVQNYECVMCHTQWRGTSPHCEKCNTHLFTTERKESA